MLELVADKYHFDCCRSQRTERNALWLLYPSRFLYLGPVNCGGSSILLSAFCGLIECMEKSYEAIIEGGGYSDFILRS